MQKVITFLAAMVFSVAASAAGLVGAGSGSTSQAFTGGGSISAGGGIAGTTSGVQTVSGGTAVAKSTPKGVRVGQTSFTGSQGGSLTGSLGNAGAGSLYGGTGSSISGAGAVGIKFP